MATNGLARIEQGIALLAEAKKAITRGAPVPELKQLRDQSEALRSLVKKAALGLDVQNLAAESKLRTERAIGDALLDMKRNGQRASGRGSRKTDLHDASPPTLSDLGIEQTEAHRWQKIASIPEKVFEKHIEETKENEDEITTAGTLLLSKMFNKKQKSESIKWSAKTEITEDLPALIASGTKFACVYADPPWKYGNQGTRASTDNHYPTLTVPEIAAMPVTELVADEALLFLWTTNGFLFESKNVIDSWGFEFKSSIVWVKPQIGIGNYVRNSHEFLLIASRGGMLTTDAANAQISWIESKRTDHSRKPHVFREIIENISIGPRIEMFGREKIEGWTVFGNQVKGLFERGE